MKIEDVINEFSKRQFVKIENIEIKLKNKELLDELKDFGLDYSGIIDIALDNLGLEKLLKDIKKKKIKKLNEKKNIPMEQEKISEIKKENNSEKEENAVKNFF